MENVNSSGLIYLFFIQKKKKKTYYILIFCSPFNISMFYTHQQQKKKKHFFVLFVTVQGRENKIGVKKKKLKKGATVNMYLYMFL